MRSRCVGFAAAASIAVLAIGTPAFAETAQPCPAAPSNASAAPLEPETPVSTSPTTVVEFEADRPTAVLERLDEDWRPICFAHCKAVLLTDARYRIAGNGILRSKPFVLPDGPHELSLAASTSTPARPVVGAIVGIVGGLSLTIGLLDLLAATALSGLDDEGGGRSQLTIDPAGAAFLVSGLVVGATGLAIMLTSETSVTTTPGSSSSLAAHSRKLFGPVELGPRGFVF